MNFTILTFIFLSLAQYALSSPAPQSITAIKIVTKYIVVPYPKPFPRNLLVEARSFLGLEDRSLICEIDAVLLAFKLVAAEASPFCRSYLHLAPSTTVVVTTPVTTTTATSTSTITNYLEIIERRAKATPIPTPSGLSHFLVAQISSACSCLSIPVGTTTTTSTAPAEVSTSIVTTTTTTVITLPPETTS